MALAVFGLSFTVDAARAQSHMIYPYGNFGMTPQLPAMPMPMHMPMLTSAPAHPPAHAPLIEQHAPVVYQPCIENNFSCYFFGDYLLMRPRDNNVAFAQPFAGLGVPGSTPIGPAAVVSLDYAMGVRGGGGFALDDRSYVEARVTYYDNDSQARAGIPNGAPADTVLRALLVHQNTSAAEADSLTAEAALDIELVTADVTWKNLLVRGPRYFAMYHLGVHAAKLTQSLEAEYQLLGTVTVNSEIDFIGFGPRAGIEGEYHCRGGLYSYGRGFLNVLAGRFDATYAQNRVLAGLEAASGIEEDRVVPITELELGVGWTSVGGNFRFSVGLQTMTWFNAMTMNSWLEGATSDSINDTTSSMSFDGAVGRIEFRW